MTPPHVHTPRKVRINAETHAVHEQDGSWIVTVCRLQCRAELASKDARIDCVTCRSLIRKRAAVPSTEPGPKTAAIRVIRTPAKRKD